MAKKKVKARKAQATKQKKVAKAKARRKQFMKNKALSKQGAVSMEKKVAALIYAFEQSPDYLYWIGHGINMLASNYEDGEWTPVFPELYEDGFELTNTAVGKYLTKHFNKETKTWTAEGRRAVGWASSPVTNIYAIQQKCIAEAEKNGLDPKSAACGPVWRVFGIMKSEIDKRMGDTHLDISPEAAMESTTLQTVEP